MRWKDFLNKELIKWIVKVPSVDKFRDHDQQWLDCLAENSSKHFIDIEMVFAKHHYLVEVRKEFGATREFLQPLLVSDFL